MSVETVISDPDFTLLHGEALEALRTLPAESIQMVVTSPPYWGLRDYGTGAWEGGDPECDHVERRPTPHSGLPNAGANSPEAMRATVERLAEEEVIQYRETCGKCGAVRVDDQLGLEPSPEEYIAKMVGLFREVRRVLRPDGTVWLNMGDSYASGNKGGPWDAGRLQFRTGEALYSEQANRRPIEGLKPKDLCMIPARLAIALQEDGWWLRSQIVWSKPNAMPESVTDRPTTSHEFVYLLAKSHRYYFDQDAVREPWEARPQQRLTPTVEQPLGAARVAAGVQQGDVQGGAHASPFRVQEETLGDLPPEAPRGPDGRRVTHVEAREGSHQHRSGERWPGLKPRRSGNVERTGPTDHGAPADRPGNVGRGVPWEDDGMGRNIRTVWTIVTQPYPGAHFAVFPEELARRCIAAGTSEAGCCPECGAPWERQVARGELVGTDRGGNYRGREGEADESGAKRFPYKDGEYRPGMSYERTLLGWRPGCACAGPDLEPIDTPTGERAGDDPTATTGRKGMNRPRGEGEGTRPITRYEQAAYAEQLRASPHRELMEQEAGAEAFAHYVRTDRSGARPVPPALLEDWIARDLLARVELPAGEPPAPVPCTVLDPFLGSGTTAVVARKLGRNCVGIELKAAYCEMIATRTAQLSLLAEGA